jgi:hypothetical protein
VFAKPTDGTNKVHLAMLLKELDAVTLRLAGKALIAVVTWKYYEAAYVLVVMEWAQSEVSRPPLFKRNERANHVHDVSRFDYAPNGKVIYFAHKPIFNCLLIVYKLSFDSSEVVKRRCFPMSPPPEVRQL